MDGHADAHSDGGGSSAMDGRHADAHSDGGSSGAAASEAAGSDEPFIKGVGLHVWQGSGDDSSNWSAALRSWRPTSWLRFAVARLRGGLTVLEVSPDFWNRYEQDAELAASLGCNGFRLSLEWSRIEPRQGFIDSAAVARYRAIFAALRRRGMQPNVSLMHFTTPAWFEKIGGWAVEDNIALFVEYAVRAVQLFGDQVQLWATFNEATSASTMGYVFGAYPPGEILQLKTAGVALLNMLRAHTAAYRAIKALPGGERQRIGLAHMVIPFTHWPDLGPLTKPAEFAASWLTFWWGYELMHEWLLTGKFSWCVPSITGGRRCVFEVKEPRPPLDWYGLNYYSRPHISPLLTPGRKPWQVLSDLGYPIDAEGMHEVLVRSAAYGVPVYVTETGVSIASQRHRSFMVDAYVKEVLRSMREGVDVRGIYYWTLVDTDFEWNAGFSIKFGLFEWSPWPWGKDRAPRAAAGTLKELYARLPASVGGVRQAVRRMDLGHAALVPLPRSVVWWLGSAVLMYLQLLEWLYKGLQLLLLLLSGRQVGRGGGA